MTGEASVQCVMRANILLNYYNGSLGIDIIKQFAGVIYGEILSMRSSYLKHLPFLMLPSGILDGVFTFKILLERNVGV